MATPSPMGWLRRKLRGARGYSAGEIALVPPSLLLLGLARAAILVVPFRHHAALLGRPVSQGVEAPPLTPAQDARARAIGRAVRASAQVTPWQSICLPQAMAASVLLRFAGVPHVVHFGLGDTRPEDAPMDAHAWTLAGTRVVTGGPVDPGQRIVASFARSRRR